MSERRPYPLDSRYSVTTDGRVFRDVAYERCKPREMTQYPSKRGYLRVLIGGEFHNVHQVVARTFIPNPENKPEVAHGDGCKTNNHVGNLRWATRKENSDDMDAHGTRRVGEDCRHAVLTEAQVLEIRSIVASRGRRQRPYQREIAEAFGVTRECVTRIANGDRWKHATAP